MTDTHDNPRPVRVLTPREQMVSDLRELASFLEHNPDFEVDFVDSIIVGQHYTDREQWERAVRALGPEVREHITGRLTVISRSIGESQIRVGADTRNVAKWRSPVRDFAERHHGDLLGDAA